jgi:hypothetical protein
MAALHREISLNGSPNFRSAVLQTGSFDKTKPLRFDSRVSRPDAQPLTENNPRRLQKGVSYRNGCSRQQPIPQGPGQSHPLRQP